MVRGDTTIGSYATLQQVKDIGGWQSGDVVKATGGTYVVYGTNDPGNTTLVSNTGGIQTGVLIDTTIEWETPGQPMILDYSRYWQVGMLSGGQPQLLTMGQSCRNLTIRGLHFRGARPPKVESRQGAAIWTAVSTAGGTHPPATLTVEYCKFWQCIDGIHTQQTHYGLSTYVRYCVFEDNSDPQGLRHDIYTGRNALAYILGCTFRKTKGQGYPQAGMGHAIKSRCRATTVLGNMLNVQMFSDGTGGCAQNINTPNGGVVVIAGNVINHYGSLSNNQDGNGLRYGEDQYAVTVDTNQDPSLTSHSILLAQNTLRKYNGRPADGSDKPLISIYPTGVATMLLDGTGGQIPVTAIVRNNLVASDTTRARSFVALYPNNTEAPVSRLADSGIFSGGEVAGFPEVNDAPYEWAGDFTIPIARADSYRGGRTVFIPDWVPTTAWEWTDIPGTRWLDYIKDDGSGVTGATKVTSLDPGPGRSYAVTWDYSGPCYSPKNHEVWMFGGGHAGTTINILTKYNLHKNLPDVVVVSPPTPEAMRREYALAPNHLAYAKKVYWPDGKPYSAHSYTNSFYVDALDEWFQFGVSGCASSVDGVAMSGPGIDGRDVVGFPRNDRYRMPGYWTAIPATGDGVTRGYRSIAGDQTGIYYWNRSGTPGLRKFTFATNTYTFISGTTPPEFSRPSDEHDGVVFICGTDTSLGWSGQFCNMSTGAMTTVKFTGPALPKAANYLMDVIWIAPKGYYVTVWINASAVDWGASNVEGNLTTIVIATVTPTGSSTAKVEIKTIAGSAPRRNTVIRGVFFDPTYECLILPVSYANNVKAVKVA
ncbi:MAG: hypothetical protein A3E79_13950 [Burkholderiales bacterium RIFCSPHIGHO2_12_FULL_61_11]|nr:MAG: hypothetical protein A3E79_13950 [Burkholderiales bacterium RIFCSPHIGHO2_12_FULL_61_11]